MATPPPAPSYDIFISYRHNDNLDGWVTDFVQHLEKELRSTIKEPLTIYFDKNPSDGILETHNVEKSLEGKLNCRIFIPIISQTYCDPKSFAWQQEFCPFNKLAKESDLGREIRLSNGNVASRILCVKIHDLDVEDKAAIEIEMGGALRAIEFIFKSSGVNRPLRANEDHPHDNLNKTFYRDQINKVANSIKEILSGIKNPEAPSARKNPDVNPVPRSNPFPRRVLIGAATLIAMTVVVYLTLFRTATEKHKPEVIGSSIAVLPFVDLSAAKDQEWFADGLTEEILNSLAHVKGLQVASRTSSFSFKNKNLRIQDIADSLGVNYIVEGSVRTSPTGTRITAQLIRANDGFHIWSNTYDRNMNDIFVVQQDIATKIAESLNISLDPQAVQKMQRLGTTNPEAFLFFLKGQEFFRKAHNNRNFILSNLKEANVNFSHAIALDPDFVNAYIFHADFFLHYMDSNGLGSDSLTEAEAYRLLVNDFDNAVAKSKEPIDKDFYRLHSIMYSSDWSSMRPIVERLLNSPEAPRLFTYQSFSIVRLIHRLGYDRELAKIDSAILESDPGNIEVQRDIIWSIISLGDFDQALDILHRVNNSLDPELNFDEVFSLYKLGKIEDAEALLSRMDSSTMRYYNTSLALVHAKKGDPEKAKKILEKDKIDYLLFSIDAVHGRKAANLEASRLDKKPVDFALLFSYLYSPNNPPFDFSATPNFARKLTQAGIEIKSLNRP